MKREQGESSKLIIMKMRCRKKILAWAKTKKEIGFLCAGKNGLISHVFKIKNKSDDPRNRFKWDNRRINKQKAKIKRKGLVLLAEGHSHPNRRHSAYPSLADIRYFSRKRPHLIAFPLCLELRAWKLEPSVRETMKSSLLIVLK